MDNVPLEYLHPDPRNANVCPPDTLAKIRANIERTGLCPALIVRPHPELPEHYMIVDGHHRAEVLRELGWTSAPCDIWSLSEADIPLALATLNRLRGEDNPRKRAVLLEELTDLIAMPDLVQLIPESRDEVGDLLSLLSADTGGIERQLAQQTQQEAETLPTPFHCMIPPEYVPATFEALERFQGDTPREKGMALGRLAQYVLTQMTEENKDGK